MINYILIGFSVLSLLTFIVYGLDKRAAIHDEWRTPEKRLLLFGIMGGAAGGLLGMAVFRHKIRKWYFWFVNFLSLIVHIAVLVKCLEMYSI
ncbi:MAG: DUF1294 domain-containing protein [Oscillospiraceae bacterium]|nr:DUF1294 domain-containing protein [Oscillospiraceae bacterium]